jgi:hypothetical protein
MSLFLNHYPPQINSIVVFNDARKYLDKAPKSATRLDSANQVWLCEFVDGERVVLKYFDPSGHSKEHFDSEFRIFQLNPLSSALPNLLFSDSQRLLLGLEYIEQSKTPPVSIDSLIELAHEMTCGLLFDADLHSHVPGIIGIWENHNVKLAVSEELLLSTAHASDPIESCLTRIVNLWKPDVHLHGDLKLANLLFSDSSFRIIDWESHCLGPIHWDSAGLIQSCLLDSLAKGPYHEWSIQQIPIIRLLLDEGPDELVDSVVARLLQSSIEASQTLDRISILSANLLQLADFIARGDHSFMDAL